MDLTRAAVAEAIGTFALVFVGAGSIVVGMVAFGDVNLVAVALAHGLTIFAMVHAFGHISGGHFNPAVTAGLLVARKIDARSAGVYVLAQLVGAAVGAFLLLVATRGWAEAAAEQLALGTPAVGSGADGAPIPMIAVLLVEIVLTFLLVTVIQGTIDPRNTARVGGLAIGLTVTLDILVGGPISGAAMNPARWFGPALVSGRFVDGWLYIVAPLLGGILSGLVYGGWFAKATEASPAPRPE